MAQEFQLVIRGGTIADGSGKPLFVADVAVSDGRIAQIGQVSGQGVEEIDARGMLVTPGFVDAHTHYDGQASWDACLQPSSWHGVTTAVMGNCGVGFAPVRAQDRQRLIELMEGVEDIPGAALHEGLDWRWESFAQYMDALDEKPHDIDFCAQLPHGALRVYVMGERGANLEAATPADVAQMRALAADAMRAGAVGFSSSRTLNHKSIKGEPTPSLRATEDELMGIALGLKDAGSGVLEMISDFNSPDVDTEFAMLRRLVERSGRPMSISLGQNHRKPEGWRGLLGRIETARNEGVPMLAQVAPRPIGVLLGLIGSRNPFSGCPAYKAIADKPLAERVALMRDPAMRATLVAQWHEHHGEGGLDRRFPFELIYPLGEVPDYEPPAEQSIAAIAARAGRDPADVAYDLLLEQDGSAMLFAPFANYAHNNLEASREMMTSDATILGLGDGGAHVGLISDASFTTYALTHWGRDRATGRFPLEYLVKRQTRDTAAAMGLTDRGMLVPGLKADINVIDMAKLAIHKPTMAFDLPAGGKRLLQRASGYVATIVNGVVVYRDGVATGALPGRLVRMKAPAGAAVAAG